MCASNAITFADAMGNKMFDKRKGRGRIDGMVSIAQSVGASFSEFRPKKKQFTMLVLG